MQKIILILVFLFLVSNLGLAAGIPYWGPIMSCNTIRLESGGWLGKYKNPCSSLCDLLATMQNAISLGITIALFVLAPILFMVGGFYLVTSGGNQERLGKGKKIFINTAWGVAIVLLSFVIVNTFLVILAPKISNEVNFARWNEIQCNPSKLPGTVEWNIGPSSISTPDRSGSRGVTETW